MKRILMILMPLVVIGMGGFAAITMVQNRPKPETKTVEIPPPLIRVLRVEPEDVRLSVYAEGTVEPGTAIQLMPEVSGRVLWVNPNFRVGGFFEEGELIGKIDPREYELEVVRSRAAIAQAKLRLATELQEAEVARKEWESMGSGSEPEPLVVREPQIAQARAELASAEAALAKAEYDLERTVVKAPFAGRVVSKIADQFVSRGQPMAVIYAIDYAEVRLPIPDRDLAYINLPLAYRGSQAPPQGPTVILRAKFAGKEYKWWGRIVVTEGQIDQESRMLHAVAEVKDPYGRGGQPGRPPLAVGMFVEAEIKGKTARDVVVLPRTAMRASDEVLVVDQDDRLRFRKVDVLRTDGDRVIIQSGLEAGDRVGISVVEAAVDGMRVRVIEADEQPTGGGSQPRA